MAMNEQNQHHLLVEKYPVGEPVTFLDGTDVRRLFRGAYDWLAHNHELVNRMNVFPVPDGDTGTNMLLTLKAAWASIVDDGSDTVGGVVAAAASGAHHGSRGNSGVILGQLLHGVAQSLSGKERMTPHDLASALGQGSEAAYAAVPTPVEGTILTVSRDVHVGADAALAETNDIREMLEAIVEAANVSVERTPDLLPILKKAGVVDSGGKGLYFFFDGMYRALTGQLSIDNGDEHLGDMAEAAADHAIHKGERALPPVEWGFDVQFLVEQPSKSVGEILTDISAMGDCPLVEGDDRLVKVHVHVFDPGEALSYGVKLGFVTDVVVENMDDMAAAAHIGVDGAAGNSPAKGPSFGRDLPDSDEIGLIAVSPGDGFTAIFHDLGVHAIVGGGQTMNPSTAQIVEAIDALPSRRVILLPNNGNIVMAAEQAAKLAMQADAEREVQVVASKTLPQGVAALLAFDPGAEDVELLAGAMATEMAHIQTGEVTQAVRSGDFDGLTVEVGDIIGLHNGRLVLSTQSLADAVLELLALMVDDETEIVTLYHGDFVAEGAAENLVEQVRGVYPELDIEVAYGGQPHYFYILSAE